MTPWAQKANTLEDETLWGVLTRYGEQFLLGFVSAGKSRQQYQYIT